MKTLIKLLMPLIFCQQLCWATEIWKNDREKESQLLNQRQVRNTKNIESSSHFLTLKKTFRQQWQQLIQSPQQCSIDTVHFIHSSARSIGWRHQQVRSFFHLLRVQDEIDDPQLAIIEKYLRAIQVRPRVQARELLNTQLLTNQMIETLERINAGGRRCLTDQYIMLRSSVQNPQHIPQVLSLAYHNELISAAMFNRLSKMHMAGFANQPLSLKSYLSRKADLRTQRPLQDLQGSQFANEENRRLHFYNRFNTIQIIHMAEIVKTLRHRINGIIGLELHVKYEDENDNEVIGLTDMEIFRFCLRQMRKDKNELKNNFNFQATTFEYQDLIMAALETGDIAASEVDALYQLEEIWAPNQTFFQRASSWIRIANTVSVIVLPPPFGFIPTLALIAIEAIHGGENQAEFGTTEHTLF